MKSLSLVALVVLPAAFLLGEEPKELAFKFGKDSLGKVPAGWKVDRTGKGQGSQWQVVEDASAPSGAGYVLAQVAKSPNAMFNLCVVEKSSFKDVEITVHFRPVDGDKDQGGGVVWRYQDADNYYIARQNPLENNFRLYKVAAGKRTQLATAEVDIGTGKWATMSIKMVGDRIECSINGKKYLQATDSTFDRAGAVGLWTKADAKTYFDGLKVRPAGK